MARRENRFQQGEKDDINSKLIAINRVTKVVKGGKTMRFSALIVAGDGQGRLGLGMGKAAEVSEAIKKAMPAEEGTGVIAGGPVRAVLEVVGIKDIRTKSIGTNNPINCVKATIDALKQLRTVEQVAALRGKTVEEILG